MQTLASLIKVNKEDKLPVYLQLSAQLMELIKQGILPGGTKVLSSRTLAALVHVNRSTIVKAYAELEIQGWFETHSGKGTFVSSHIQELSKPKKNRPEIFVNPLKHAGFKIPRMPILEKPVLASIPGLHLDDGFPDARLAPLTELSRAYRTQLLTGNLYSKLGYSETKGSLRLREQLSIYLNATRGLKTNPENILIVRGAMMGFYLMVQALLKVSDHIILSRSGWIAARMAAEQSGVRISYVDVDEYGLDVDQIERICEQGPIRMVYVTSHHHYPTTVALRPDRRIKLLRLAEKFGFILFEDDYDYEFHYANQPLLPLAGADHSGMVIYCGSFSKTIAPAFRLGYLVGPEDAIEHLARYRRIIDRQGDAMLENAMAEMLEFGFVQRHLRKSMNIYRQRRDIFCGLLNSELNDYVKFRVPDGGLAVWTGFDPEIDLTKLSTIAASKGLKISDGKYLGVDHFSRLGFASSTPDELQKSIDILKKALRSR
ncbi:PLP-dependent aminotransferase family protein [Pedobacter ginsengiterrae]|uniref:PLP-dependent aminotransferase family protein n=1 Tax=Pedobacter ginsengiterrae TaxID=871696 RepID=A0ABP7PG74_9SPHI